MDNWDLMKSWNLVLPPSRPSNNQLLRIKRQIVALDRSSPVAILGSTPEFRDLLVECGFQKIYIFERNINFYEAMTNSRIYKHSGEILIEGDWLDTLKEADESFTLILSDLTSGNIPYDRRQEFYFLISLALCSNGIFIDKVLTHPDENIDIDFLVKKYSNLPLNLININYFSSEMLFCSKLLDLNNKVDTTLFYSFLEETIDNERVLAFIERSKQITPPGFMWWYGIKWNHLSKDYCPMLISKVYDEEPASPYFRRAKHFIFKKR